MLQHPIDMSSTFAVAATRTVSVWNIHSREYKAAGQLYFPIRCSRKMHILANATLSNRFSRQEGCSRTPDKILIRKPEPHRPPKRLETLQPVSFNINSWSCFPMCPLLFPGSGHSQYQPIFSKVCHLITNVYEGLPSRAFPVVSSCRANRLSPWVRVGRATPFRVD